MKLNQSRDIRTTIQTKSHVLKNLNKVENLPCQSTFLIFDDADTLFRKVTPLRQRTLLADAMVGLCSPLIRITVVSFDWLQSLTSLHLTDMSRNPCKGFAKHFKIRVCIKPKSSLQESEVIVPVWCGHHLVFCQLWQFCDVMCDPNSETDTC